MSNYSVTIAFTGSITYAVKAKDEHDAEDMALDLLSGETAEAIVDNLGKAQIVFTEKYE